jgi:hypothetical protein
MQTEDTQRLAGLDAEPTSSGAEARVPTVGVAPLATKKGFKKNGTCDLNDYNRLCCAAVAQQAGCDQKCLEEQLANNPGVPKSIKNIEHRPSNSNVSLDNNQKASLCKQANLPVDVPKRR